MDWNSAEWLHPGTGRTRAGILERKLDVSWLAGDRELRTFRLPEQSITQPSYHQEGLWNGGHQSPTPNRHGCSPGVLHGRSQLNAIQGNLVQQPH